jgi:hypothetical protein
MLEIRGIPTQITLGTYQIRVTQQIQRQRTALKEDGNHCYEEKHKE